MTTVTIAFEAKGERGRDANDYDDVHSDNNYGEGVSYGQGRTISGSIVGKRGQTITFTRYAGGNRGLNVYYHGDSGQYFAIENGWHGGEGGGAAALIHNTQHIVIAGGGGGRGGRYGNSGGNAGSYHRTVSGGSYQGGQDGGGGDRRGWGGWNGNGGKGGDKYTAGRAAWDGNSGGNSIDIYQGGHGGSGEGKSNSDGAGGGGAGWGGGGGGGGHGDDENAGQHNSGGGGGGDSMIHTTSTDDVYVSGNTDESFNTNTTAQVQITHLSQTVTLNANNNQFTFSTPTTFNDTTFSFEKDVLIETINLNNEGVFSDTIAKTYTYFGRLGGSGNSFVKFPQTVVNLSTNTNCHINPRGTLVLIRRESIVETLELEVYTEATVTGITETSNTFTITLKFTNNPPTVTAITQSVHWNSIDNSFNFSGSDLDGDPLTYRIATTEGSSSYGTSISDANNSVTVAGSQFIVGSSNNATFTFFYRANDGFNDSTPAQITINKSNDQPTANDVTYTMHWNSSKTFGFSGNDANSDSLTYVISSGSGGLFSGDPLNLTGGNVTIDSTNTNQFSVDSLNHTNFTFYYKAFDGAEYSTVGTITIVKINTAPTASNIVRFTHTDEVTITLSGSDRDRDSVTFHKNGNPTETYGTWDDSNISASVIKYNPNSNYSLGSDTYGYYVSDLVDSRNYTITVYSGLTNIKDGGQDLTELYKRNHSTTTGYINLTNNKSNYQVNGNDLVDYFEREDRVVTSTSNLKVTVDGTTYALDQIFKKR